MPGKPLPWTLIFLHGPEDSTGWCISFWKTQSTELGKVGTVVPPEVTSGNDAQAQGDASGH